MVDTPLTTVELPLSAESKKGAVLVAGGAGYIGSHTIVCLYEAGFSNIVVIDNLVNSSFESLKRVEQIINGTTDDEKTDTGHSAHGSSGRLKAHKFKATFYKLDLADTSKMPELDAICAKHKFSCCLHFAGLKAVGESVAKPSLYYRSNLTITLNLMDALYSNGCRQFVFSSSATVYGSSVLSPISESAMAGVGITNAYGKSKYFIEEMLRDFTVAHSDFGVVLLRYFNPIGAHHSGAIGEDPSGIPNNLMPFLTQVAVGKREYLTVFGDTYDTEDGTGVRDYIHVMDLAHGHVLAMQSMATATGSSKPCRVYNLGTGKGTTVLSLLGALEVACGHSIAYKVGPKRVGDLATVFADVSLAEAELGFVATRSIADACRDSWKWQKQNPTGFGS